MDTNVVLGGVHVIIISRLESLEGCNEVREWDLSVTANFPKHELYGLSEQMRRAAVSVPSNIAEGKGHRSDKGFVNFFFHARGSLLELETQVEIARDLEYLPPQETELLLGQTKTVGKSLAGLINALTKSGNSYSTAPCFADDRRPTTDD